MLDQNSLSYTNQEPPGSTDAGHDDHHGESIVTVLWRFKWLLASFLAIGTAVGYWMYKQKPTMYRATTQLLFKSDSPLTLDATSGATRGGIPSGNLMQSLIKSDSVRAGVVANLSLKAIPSLEGKSQEQISAMVREGVKFQTLTDQLDSRDRMIAELHFDARDPQVCVAAVKAASEAISDHFQEERVTMINEFQGLIETAQEKFLTKQTQLESEYKTFRDSVQLEYDSDGKVVNPFRQRQFLLQEQLNQTEQRLRELQSESKFAASTIDRNKDDPLMVAQIIGQLSGVVDDFAPLRNVTSSSELATNDLELQRFEVEKSLIPLKTKLEQLELQYAASHPEVRAVSMQIQSSQEKLNELNAQVSQRRKELRSQSNDTDRDAEGQRVRVARARDAVEAYAQGIEARIRVTQEEVAKYQTQIADAKEKADNLTQAENRNVSLIRQIDGIKGLGEQLEHQLSALKLADVNGGITVKPLLDSGKAYATGPDLKKDLLLYGIFGLALSGLLAVLFEASAKMFRSAEAIQRELRIPVLTHIPLDEGRVHQNKGTVDPEIAELDPKLSVVHRPYSPSAEAVRGVRTAMLFDRRQFDSKVFQVTSPLPGDGKSTLAANVGCSVAQSGKRTLLIDLDLRSPRLSLRFNLEANVGLTNVLNGEIGPAEAVHQTPIENLDVLPCGPLPANPAEALTLAELGEVFQWARENYDFVIVDTPPLLMVSDPAVVTTYVDAAMLVMRIRRRCKPNSKEAVSMLRSAGARVMGIVVNKVDEVSGGASYKASASGTYQNIGYGYGDKYRKRYQQEANTQDTYVVKGRNASERLNVVGEPIHEMNSGNQDIIDPPSSPVGPSVSVERHRPGARQ